MSVDRYTLWWDLWETLLSGAELFGRDRLERDPRELNQLALEVKHGRRPLSELAELLRPVARRVFYSSRRQIMMLLFQRARAEGGGKGLRECACELGAELWDLFLSSLVETLLSWDPKRSDFALWIGKGGYGRRRLERYFRQALAQLQAGTELEFELIPGDPGSFESESVALKTISLDGIDHDADEAKVGRLLGEIAHREEERRRDQEKKLEQHERSRRKMFDKLELLAARPELLDKLEPAKRLALKEAVDARLRELFQSQLVSFRDLSDRDRRIVARVLNGCKNVSPQELSDRITLLLKLERRAERRAEARWRKRHQRRRRLNHGLPHINSN